MANNFTSKTPQFFLCNYCNFKCSKKGDFNRHLLTEKHKRLINTNNFTSNTSNDTLLEEKYSCDCGRVYKHLSSLYKHKKKCNEIKLNNKEEKNKNKEYKDIETGNNLQEIVIKLLIDNKEIKRENQKLMNTIINQNQNLNEILPQLANNTVNTINQNFNISVFLNEKCKDAITLDEFVEKIEISIKNLLTTKDKGLGEGLSNIIIDNINKLSLYERPIHCTDKKRETIYIKNEEWEKDEGKKNINNFLKKVENKQVKNIEKWTNRNPKYLHNDKLQEDYINLIKGCTSSIDKCKDKVIRKLCDNVYITKN